MAHAPEPVEQAVLDDLRRRLVATRRPVLPEGVGWDRGTDAHYLSELVGSWATEYDWRFHEERIRALPWARAGELRVLHQRAQDDDAPVVVLLHGWPDSVLRFERVLPLLTDFHVVAPCLPGFPWGEPPIRPGVTTTVMAQLVGRAMGELGHRRYVASGGDIGTGVAQRLAAHFPDQVAALHLTDVPVSGLGADDEGLTDAERDFRAQVRRWQREEGAYAHMHSTRPHTLAAALADSPAGLLAWIVEKLRGWSDCGGDVETAFPRQDLLTWVTAYWVTNTIGTSFSAYFEPRESIGPLEVPTAVTPFPHDLLMPPRELGERLFDIRIWDPQPNGGHFAAWERPEAFADAVRGAVALGYG